jgi:hypothetical protein
VRDEALKECRQLFRSQRIIPQLARAFDHHLRAIAHQMRQVVITDGREMERGGRVIEAGDKIGMGVEQGAVEIEYDKGRFHEESAFGTEEES